MASQQQLRSIVSQIRSFCELNADERHAQRYARYFTEGYDAYGVQHDALLEQKTKLIEKYRDELTLDDALELGDLLLQSGKYEEASFAILFIESYQDQFARETFQRLGQWLEGGIRNWGHTDVLCGNLLSFFLENGLVQADDMASWRDSPSKWKRRAVPVALINLLKTNRSVKPLLTFIDPMMADDERFVHQGLGWFLREAWKREPKPVESFLLKWKNTAARKIYQYATEKMSKEEKERFRREHKK